MKLSGFTFVHNAIEGGYPIVESIGAVLPHVDEVVVVDMESDDGTHEILEKLGVRVLDGLWSRDGDRTLQDTFHLHRECEHDTVIFFEADEVFEDRLLENVKDALIAGHSEVAIHRLKLEQNFQRCRWYPFPVTRVVRKGYEGYVPSQMGVSEDAFVLPTSAGYLWDISNCFRDNWLRRLENQSELWGQPRFLMVPYRYEEAVALTEEDMIARLGAERWTWTGTPFALPEILKPLVGMTKYEARIQENADEDECSLEVTVDNLGNDVHA